MWVLKVRARPTIAMGILAVPAGRPGPAGPPGPASGAGFTKTASIAVSGHRIVRTVSATEVAYCDAASPAHVHAALGITTAAAMAGDSVVVVAGGELTEPSWSWVPGAPIYCGLDGALTQVPSLAWAWQRAVGVASSSTSMVVGLQPPIVLAP